MFKTEIGEFKGSKTISILFGDRRVISFGVSKAKSILAVVDDIKKFVEDSEGNSKSNKSTSLESLTKEEKELVKEFLRTKN